MSTILDEKPGRISPDDEKGHQRSEDPLGEEYRDLPADPDAHLSQEEKAVLVRVFQCVDHTNAYMFNRIRS
jgi:hypothetical protein